MLFVTKFTESQVLMLAFIVFQKLLKSINICQNNNKLYVTSDM